ADRGEHLVPGRDVGAVDRPVLHRAPLRPGQLAPGAGTDTARADPRELLAKARRGQAPARPAAGAPEAPGGPPLSDPMVKPEAVHKRFGRLEVLKGISDRKSTRLNSSHQIISYAVFCLK